MTQETNEAIEQEVINKTLPTYGAIYFKEGATEALTNQSIYKTAGLIGAEDAANKWIQGFACACAITMRNHEEETIVRDTYMCNFKTVEELKKCGVDDSDIEILTPIINEIIRRNNL